MNFLDKVRVLIWKEITSEIRAKEMLSSMLVFSLLVVAFFGFALDADNNLVARVFPGILWVTLTFAGILGLNRSFVSERQNDCIHGLMLCPVDRSAIYFAKTVMNLLLMGIVEIVTIPLFFVLFNYSPPVNLGLFIFATFLGTYGFMAVGTFLSALAANTRSSEVLLPILMIPLIVPALICTVQVTKVLFMGDISTLSPGTVDSMWLFLRLLGGYGVIFTVVPVMLFDFLLEV
jgi:heme exporter protein B